MVKLQRVAIVFATSYIIDRTTWTLQQFGNLFSPSLLYLNIHLNWPSNHQKRHIMLILIIFCTMIFLCLKPKVEFVFQKKGALSKVNVEALDMYFNLTSMSMQLVNVKVSWRGGRENCSYQCTF